MDDAEGRNIFTRGFVGDFVAGLEELEKKPRPKVVILHGRQDVFCGGGEKETLLDLCDGNITVDDLVISDRVLAAPFPIIAAMEGHAMGGGLVMALCCDIVIAAEESRYGAVFMTMGFTPGMGCTTLLREMVGPYIANEMMFTGKRFKGRELAAKATQINYILPKKDVMSKAEDIALQMSEMNIKSLYLLKSALIAQKKKLLIDARHQEDLMHTISFAYPETRKIIEERYAD
jgi:polyketide biosynthesis enoyl-CoA hydratase PksI